MDALEQTKAPVQYTPLELLAKQVGLLEEIGENQKRHLEYQKALTSQVEKLQQEQSQILEKLSGTYTIQGFVAVSDFDMAFGSLVGMLIKVALASIPAALVLGAIGWVIILLLPALLAGLGR